MLHVFFNPNPICFGVPSGPSFNCQQPRYGHGSDEGQRRAEHRGDDVRGATRDEILVLGKFGGKGGFVTWEEWKWYIDGMRMV